MVMTTLSPHQYAGTQPQNLGMGMHEVWMMYYDETSDEYQVILNCNLFYEAEKTKTLSSVSEYKEFQPIKCRS